MKRKSLFVVAVLAALPLCALAQQEQARERPWDPTTGDQARLPEWKTAEHDANGAAGGEATLPKVGPSQSSAERTADPTAYTDQHDAPTGETRPAAKANPPDARPAPGCADRC